MRLQSPRDDRTVTRPLGRARAGQLSGNRERDASSKRADRSLPAAHGGPVLAGWGRRTAEREAGSEVAATGSAKPVAAVRTWDTSLLHDTSSNQHFLHNFARKL